MPDLDAGLEAKVEAGPLQWKWSLKTTALRLLALEGEPQEVGSTLHYSSGHVWTQVWQVLSPWDLRMNEEVGGWFLLKLTFPTELYCVSRTICLEQLGLPVRKDPDAGKDWRQEEKGMTEDEMVGWHHWLNGHEFEQTLGDGEGQGSLSCCRSWGHKDQDTT